MRRRPDWEIFLLGMLTGYVMVLIGYWLMSR